MGKMIDLTNQRFNKLVVIKRVENKPNDHHIQWLCRCDCGKEVVYSSQVLRRGRAKSCGCIKKQDLTGQVFDRLTVTGYAYSKDGNRYWNCKCDCGNTTIVMTKSLTSGNTRSCGCLHRDSVIKNNIINKSKVNQAELIGKRIDYLEVLSLAPSREGLSYYLCKCHRCGTLKEIRYSDLISGKVHACGCLQSYGEQQLKEVLTAYNIPFRTQYHFNDLVSEKSYPLRFDFGILSPDNKVICLIEYQGQQHTDKNNPWYSDTLIKHDNMKKIYCEKHDIPLYYCDKETDIQSFVEEVVLPMATVGV